MAGALLEHLCARHLHGSDRMITAWLADDHVVVVAIGPHNRSSLDVYQLVLDALGAEVSDGERDKPPCCDEGGRAPDDMEAALVVADAIDALARRSRRRG